MEIHVQNKHRLSTKDEYLFFDDTSKITINKTSNLSIEVIAHGNIGLSLLNRIIELKTLSWPFSYKSQINWFDKNFHGEDLHFLLFDNSQLIGYASLTQVNATIDTKYMDLLGVGCVCTLESGKGYGNILMQTINKWLEANSQIGILFCKDSVRGFYLKNNWLTTNQTQINIEQLTDEEVMVLLFNISEVNTLSYKGKLF